MPVKFVCEECRRVLSISRRKIGTEIDCPCCGQGVHVPTEAAARARLEALEERRELRRLKRELKYPEMAVYDEPRGASAAEASSLSDPRLHQHERRTSRTTAKVKTVTADDSSSLDAESGAAVTADAPAKEPNEDWTKSEAGSQVVIDDSRDGEELCLPPVSSPKRRASRQKNTAPPETSPAAVQAEPPANDRLQGYRRAKERQNRWLKAAGIMAFGVALFLAGWFAGRSSNPNASWLESGFSINGGVMYTRATGETAPDHGAMVVFLPVDVLPRNRVDPASFVNGDVALDPNHTGVLAVEEFGGAFVKADATGEFRVELPAAGEYHVLVVSAHSAQSASDQTVEQDAALLSRYFTSGLDLIGNQRYRLTKQNFSDGEERVSHLFQVSG